MSDAHDGAIRAYFALANRGEGDYGQVVIGLAPGTCEVAVSGLADEALQQISELLTVLPDTRRRPAFERSA